MKFQIIPKYNVELISSLSCDEALSTLKSKAKPLPSKIFRTFSDQDGKLMGTISNSRFHLIKDLHPLRDFHENLKPFWGPYWLPYLPSAMNIYPYIDGTIEPYGEHQSKIKVTIKFDKWTFVQWALIAAVIIFVMLINRENPFYILPILAILFFAPHFFFWPEAEKTEKYLRELLKIDRYTKA